jgi:pantothenate kinase
VPPRPDGPTDPWPTDPWPTDPGPAGPGPADPGPADPGPAESGRAGPEPLDRDGLLAAVVRLAAARLAAGRGRVLVGLTGPPGAGKSTLAGWLVGALPGAGLSAAYLPMDGFHLANAVLLGLGRRERKGAPDTFDAEGYLAMLRRVAREVAGTVYAPRFHREVEESYAAEIAIGPQVRVVVTEGNYLLLAEQPWRQVRACLDAVWYVTVPGNVSRDRLVRRRIGLGQPASEAVAWADGSDRRNAELVAGSRSRADGTVSGLSGAAPGGPVPDAGGPPPGSPPS